jgi:hypothetical protein
VGALEARTEGNMLLGNGAFVAWHDVALGHEAEYDRWHSHEHMRERVAIAGFRRGRRYITNGQGPRYLVLYEVADVGVLTSPAYVERLENPTEWTRVIMPAVRGMNRTLCRVEVSFGSGIGQAMLSCRLAPQPQSAGALRLGLEAELQALATADGIVGAHLLVADKAASGTPTRESRLRGAGDAVADWVALVEGYDGAAVAALAEGPLAAGALERLGAAPGAVFDCYRLVHIVTDDDEPMPLPQLSGTSS